MQDNIQDLYKALSDEGYTADDLGSEQEFRDNFKDAKSTTDMYNALKDEGFTEEDLGSADEFQKTYMQAPAPAPVKPKPAPKPKPVAPAPKAHAGNPTIRTAAGVPLNNIPSPAKPNYQRGYKPTPLAPPASIALPQKGQSGLIRQIAGQRSAAAQHFQNTDVMKGYRQERKARTTPASKNIPATVSRTVREAAEPIQKVIKKHVDQAVAAGSPDALNEGVQAAYRDLAQQGYDTDAIQESTVMAEGVHNTVAPSAESIVMQGGTDIFKSAYSEAEKKASQEKQQLNMGNGGMMSGGTIGTNIISKLMGEKAYNEELDPDKLAKQLNQAIDKQSATKIFQQSVEQARKYGMDPKEYYQTYVAPGLKDRASQLIDYYTQKQYMPKNDRDYILSGFSDSLAGMFTDWYTKSAKQNQYKQQAISEYKPNSKWSSIARTAVGLISQAPEFALGGAAAGAVTKKIFGKAVADMVAKGATEAEANRILAAELASKGILGRAKATAAQSAVSGAVNFATLEGVDEAARQVRDDDYNVGKILAKALHGAGSGAVFGTVGGSYAGATAELTGAKKIVSNLLGAPVNGAALTASSNAMNAVNMVMGGEDEIGDKSLLEQWADNTMQDLMMRGTSVHNAKTAAGLLHKSTREQSIAQILSPFDSRSNSQKAMGDSRWTAGGFSKETQDKLMQITGTDNLRDALMYGVPGAKDKFAINGRPETVKPKNQSVDDIMKAEQRQVMAENWDKIMNERDIPAADKARLAAMMQAKYHFNPTVSLTTYADDNGKVYVDERDAKGNLNQRHVFNDAEQADEFQLKNGVDVKEANVRSKVYALGETGKAAVMANAIQYSTLPDEKGNERTEADQQARIKEYIQRFAQGKLTPEEIDTLNDDLDSTVLLPGGADKIKVINHSDGTASVQYTRNDIPIRTDHYLDPETANYAAERDMFYQEMNHIRSMEDDAAEQYAQETGVGAGMGENILQATFEAENGLESGAVEQALSGYDFDRRDEIRDQMLQGGAQKVDFTTMPDGKIRTMEQEDIARRYYEWLKNGGETEAQPETKVTAPTEDAQQSTTEDQQITEGDNESAANEEPQDQQSQQPARLPAYEAGRKAVESNDMATISQLNDDAELASKRVEQVVPANNPILEDVLKLTNNHQHEQAHAMVDAANLPEEQSDALHKYIDSDAAIDGMNDAQDVATQKAQSVAEAAIKAISDDQGNVIILKTDDKKTVCVKTGNINDKNATLMVQEIDGNYNPVGKPFQLPFKKIKQVLSQENASDRIFGERKRIQQQMDAYYEDAISTAKFTPGKKITLKMQDNIMNATVVGENADGTVNFQSEAGDVFSLPREDAQRMAENAREEGFKITLEQEKQAREQARLAAEAEAKAKAEAEAKAKAEAEEAARQAELLKNPVNRLKRTADNKIDWTNSNPNDVEEVFGKDPVKGMAAAQGELTKVEAAIDAANNAEPSAEIDSADALLADNQADAEKSAKIQELERQKTFWQDQINRLNTAAERKAAAEKARAERIAAEALKEQQAHRRRQANYDRPIKEARKRLADDPEALAILDEHNREPRTLEEAVADLIPLHGLALKDWEDESGVHRQGLEGELGLGYTDLKELGAYIGTVKNGATDVQGLAKRIWENLPEHIKVQAPSGDQDVKDAILKILSEAHNSDDIAHYTDNARIREAEQVYAANKAYEEAVAEHEKATGKFDANETAPTYGPEEDPFAGGSNTEAPFSFGKNRTQADIDRHNERAKTKGGLVIDAQSDRLERRTATLLDSIGRQLGKTIVVDPMMLQLGSNGQASADGKILYLSPKIAERQDSYVRFIAGHELTHLMKKASSEIQGVWDKFTATVEEAMGDDFGKQFQAKRDLYDRNYERIRQKAAAIMADPNASAAEKAKWKAYVNMPNCTDDQIREEVVCDWAGEHVLKDEQYVKNLMQRCDENHVDSASIAKRMKDFINKVLDYLKGIKTPTLSERRAQIALERARDIWSDMYELSAAKQREREGKSTETTAEIADAPVTDEKANKIQSTDDGDVIVSENKLTGTQSFNFSTEVNPSFTIRGKQWSAREFRKTWINRKVAAGEMTEEQGKFIEDFMNEQTDRALKQGEDSKEMRFWNNATIAVNEKGQPMFTVVIPDDEYPINFGISLVCKRRRALDRVMRELASSGLIDQLKADPLNIVAINQIIKEHGLEVGCDLCYVEARRFRSIPNADTFTSGWNEMIKSLDPKGEFGIGHHNFGENKKLSDADNAETRPMLDEASNEQVSFKYIDKVMREEKKLSAEKAAAEGKKAPKEPKSIRYRQAKFIKEHPEVRRLLDRSDFVDSKGFENAHRQNKPILALFNGTFGASNPKNSLGDTPYNSEILRRDRFFTRKKAYNMGGVRFQSFDDYVGKNWLDYLMAHADMAVRGIPAHSYSKEELYVKTFGLTGNKINMSGVPDAIEGCPAGLDQDGNYLFHEGYDIQVDHNGEKKIVKTDRQTFPWAEAVKIRKANGYRDNCGTIVVGVSDEHIWKMQHDNDVDMIIGYHASSLNPAVAHAMGGVARFTDYTNVQNERYGNSFGDKAGTGLTKADKAKVPNINLLMAPKEVGGKDMTPRQAIETYVRWCEDHDILPKFDKFCCKREDDAFNGKEQYYTDENGVQRRVIDDGYYKHIADFKVIAQDENGNEYDVKQHNVSLTLPTGEDAFGSFNDLTDRGVREWQETHDDIESELYKEDGKGIINEINDRIINGSMTEGLRKISEQRMAEAKARRQQQANRNVHTEAEAEESAQGGVSFSFVEDPKEIERLDKEKKVIAYRSMQLVDIDGEKYLVPPMASKVDGQWVDPIKVNPDGTVEKVWLRSDEHPEMVADTGKYKNKFYLDKGNGKGLWAAYNPYNHLASTMLNDQFSEAQSRPNLVSVACEVPESEAEADPATAYKADKAKDSVGRHEWKAGPIQGNLTGTRELILSRWCKPAQVVPNTEVAKDIYDKIHGQIDVMPTNVVPPAVRQELEKMGVDFIETNNKNQLLEGEHYGDQYTWWYGKNAAKNYRKHLRDVAKKHGMTPQEYEDLRNQYREEARQEGVSIQKMLEQNDPRFAKDEAVDSFSFEDDDMIPEDPKTPEQEKREESDNFKNWFGDWQNDPQNASKVVDEEGRPLIVHHGTSSYGFTVFDTSRDWNQDNVGSHFGSKNTAKSFDDSIYNVYLDIKKPWEAPFDFFADNYNNAYLEVIEELRKEVNNKNIDVIADRIKQIYPHIPEDIWQRAKEEGFGEVFADDEYLDNDHFDEDRQNLVTILRDMLEAAGYDGIKYDNWYEGSQNNECWVALYPNQIKSADTEGEMANNGEFDPNNEDIRFQFDDIPEDIPIRDGKIDGAKMIREGNIMRLAEVISKDTGADKEKKEKKAEVYLKKVDPEIRKQLSINIAAISNGTLSDMSKRVNKFISMPATDVTPEFYGRADFDKEFRNRQITIEEDGMKVSFNRKSVDKLYSISDLYNLGITKNFEKLLAESQFAYSQPRTQFDDPHIDGTKHPDRQNMYEYRNYLTKINIKGKGERYLRFTLMRSDNGDIISHGAKMVDVALIKIPSDLDLSSLSGRKEIIRDPKEFDAKLQNFFEIANSGRQISDKSEHFMPFIGENGVVTGSDGKIFDGHVYNKTEDPTRTANFKNWFGDWQNDPENASKVVKKNGEPLVVYHGTPDWNFNSFDKSKIGSASKEDKEGFFFISNRQYAQDYAEGFTDNPRVIAAYVNIRKPLIIDADTISKKYNRAGDPEGPVVWDLYKNEILKEAHENNCDGVIIEDEYGQKLCVPFEPNQIKSATENNGDFDPQNEDIRFSFGPLPVDAARQLSLFDANGEAKDPEQQKKDFEAMKKRVEEHTGFDGTKAGRQLTLFDANGETSEDVKNGVKQVIEQNENTAKVIEAPQETAVEAAKATAKTTKKTTSKKGLQDFGEKIGMARKDTATRGYTREGVDNRPAWRKKYQFANMDPEEAKTMSVYGFAYKFKEPDGETDTQKPFVAYIKEPYKRGGHTYIRRTPITGADNKVMTFTSAEEAEAAIPVFEAKQQGFKVIYDKDSKEYLIGKTASTGKLMTFESFPTQEEAALYLASPQGCRALLNHKPVNYELPPLDKISRSDNMPDYRHGKNVTPEQFMQDFGFRGGEFGNWVNENERQSYLNVAYDSLMDLANIIGISPRALSLNGKLAIAFGARGGAGTVRGAVAHFEPQRVVINMTKLKGAGSLAHEWAHAFDNYFGMQDAKIDYTPGDSNTNADHYLSRDRDWHHGTRSEVADIIHEITRALQRKKVTREVQADETDENIAKIQGQYDSSLQRYRDEYARGRRRRKYNRKTKEYEWESTVPTEEDLKKFDELAKQLPNDPTFEFVWNSKKGRWEGSGDVASQLYDMVGGIVSETKSYGPLHNLMYYTRNIKSLKDKAAQAEAHETEEAWIPTDMMKAATKFDASRSTPYWQTEIEMFARAFETYVANKLQEKGQESNYLTYMKGERCMAAYKISPYPMGEELANVTKLFDKLFDTVEERPGDNGNTALFSFSEDSAMDVPEGKTKAQLQAETDAQLARQQNTVREGDTMSDVVRKAGAIREADKAVQLQQTIADNQIKPGDDLQTVLRKAEALKATRTDVPSFSISREERAHRAYEREKKRQEKAINEAQAAIRKKVVDEITHLTSDKHMTVFNRSTLNRLLKDVQNATADNLEATVASARTEINKLTDKSQQREIERMLKLKTQDVNGKNMSVAKNVSDSVRRIMGMIQGRVVDLKATGYEEDMTQLRRQNIFIKGENTRLENQLYRLRQETPEGERTQADIDADIKAAEDKIQENNQKHDSNLEELRDLKQKKAEAEAAKAIAGDADIDEELAALNKKMDDHVAGEATWTLQDSEKMTGLQILQMKRQADTKRNDIAKMEKQLEDLEDSLASLEREAKKPMRYVPVQRIEQLRNQVASMKAAIDAETKSMIGIQGNVIDTISGLIEEGKNSLLNKIEGEKNRKFKMLHGMLGDIQGKKSIPTDIKEQGETHKEGKIKKFFSAQLHSFEYLAKRINENTIGEDGWFYKHFVKGQEGVLQAQNNYLEGVRDAVSQLDGKAKEIYDGKTFNQVANENSKVEEHPGVFLQIDQAGMPINEEIPLSKAQAMYIYMVWKMPDGKMKLQLQGFTDESLAQVRDFIGDQNAEYADWMQEEFLKNLRAKYNDRYVEMYNTSMTDIDNYVPLKIVGDDVKQDSDLSDDAMRRKTLEERAGSLINRRFNTHRVDITHGAFDVIAEHVNQMEEWNAFARVRKDLDYVLSNTYVRNQLDANSAGRYNQLYDASAIAAHAYHPDSAKYMDDVVGWLTKGLVGGNIAYRYTTAMKQILSVPAFYGYSHDPRYLIALTKNIGVQYGYNAPAVVANMISLGFSGKRGFKLADQGKRKGLLSENVMWCMKNVPSFRDRVLKGTAGMEFMDDQLKGKAGKLVDAYLDYGMATNQMIDAVTCSIGIKSIFDYKYGKMAKAINADDTLTQDQKNEKLAEARRQAITEADIYYNATQQSNHAAFMAPMQLSRTMVDRALSVYQNASIGYARRAASTAENLIKMAKDWKRMKSNYVSEIMNDNPEMTREEATNQANSYMKDQLTHNLIGAALYGVALNWLWDWGGRGLLGLFQGDDGDKEKELRVETGLDNNSAIDMTEIAGKMAEWSSYPLRGLTGMNISSALINGNLSQPLLFYTEMDDLKQQAVNFWKDQDYVGLASAAFFKGLRVAGFDWKVWQNIVEGAAGLMMDACTANRDSQAMIDLMLALNTPNSNRKAVAENIYKDYDRDTYVRNIMKAAKYTTSEYTALLPGMKLLTAQRELAIYKEFALNHLTDDEMKQLKSAQKELIKHFKSLEDLQTAYDKTTDPTLKNAIGLQLIKTMKAERPKTAQTADQLIEKAKKSLLVKEVKNKAYLNMCNSTDCLEDEYLKELRQELKKVNDEYEEMMMDSPEAAEQYVEQNKKEYEEYKTVQAYSTRISNLKGKLEKVTNENDKQTLIQAIRELRKSALGVKNSKKQ